MAEAVAAWFGQHPDLRFVPFEQFRQARLVRIARLARMNDRDLAA